MENTNSPQPAPPVLLPPEVQPPINKLVWTLLTLMFFPPLGILLMWLLMKDWPKKAKIIVTTVYGVLLLLVVTIHLSFLYILLSTPPNKGILYSQNLQERERKNQPVFPTASPTPVLSTREEWKTYRGETAYSSDGSSQFSIQYPARWTIIGNRVLPLGEQEDKGLEPVIILGAGGHGGGTTAIKVDKTFPAGRPLYYMEKTGNTIEGWVRFEIDNNDYIIEFRNLPENDEETLDRMLETFTVIK